MKKLIPCLLLVLAACSSTQPALDCATAQRTYALYQASLAVRTPTADEIKSAQLAGAFLAAVCGWTSPPPTTPPAKDPRGTLLADKNGVPIVVPK